jgi:uncharacterized membrane protein
MSSHEGSFVRWQAITIAQLGFTSNLILTLAVASLGFSLTLVKDNDFTSSCWARCLLVISIVGLLIALALGIWCALNRLADFRMTAQIARGREKLPTMTSEQGNADREKDLNEKRKEVKQLGNRTWTLFYWQVGTFAAGILALIGSFFAAYHARLF